ncbi:MAG: hypothetical protein GY845_10100 [Planctomycetes bacterium]|nr:hypothetical protein [Planctomycetota bacterium]
MAQQKKNIARLVIQAISILGILLGFGFFSSSIAMIFSFDRENLYGWLMFSGVGLVLAAFLIYPSYKMLRGRSSEVLKSIAALLALTSFSLIPFAEDLTTSDSGDMSRFTKDIIIFGSLALSWLAFILIYKVTVKLLNKLLEKAYGPKIIPETQISTDKQ